MAWIKTVGEEQAVGRLAEIYQKYRVRNGMVPNIMQAFSLKPELVSAVAHTFQVATFGGSKLTRVQEEMIATVVSSINRCHY
jgi:alkylhydroperoxidase family enzyme